MLIVIHYHHQHRAFMTALNHHLNYLSQPTTGIHDGLDYLSSLVSSSSITITNIGQSLTSSSFSERTREISVRIWWRLVRRRRRRQWENSRERRRRFDPEEMRRREPKGRRTTKRIEGRRGTRSLHAAKQNPVPER